VPKVVHAQLQLVAVGRGAVGEGHHAGVVHEDVDDGMRIGDGLAGGARRVERGKVQRRDLQ
jgi:hypothetical protein